MKWKEKKAENKREFERQLKLWNVSDYSDISPDEGNTLYILGNGFDMMHGVNSSYYSFRDSLGKTNSLRANLEHFLMMEDIWADFEEALAHLNVQFFSSRMNADNWLDIMGAYEPNAGIAEFMMAAESATQVVSDIVNRQLAECDAELTKDCDSIIKKHKTFFDGIKSTKTIITVGHSFSKIDWPYFVEIISALSTEHPVQWYFGCFGLHDLENLDCTLKEFRIDRNAVSVFRTDIINVKKNTVPDTMHGKIYAPKVKILEKSVDGKWVVQIVGNYLQVTESNSHFLNYEVEIPVCISSAWFTSDGNKLFVISRDYPSGIFLFGLDDRKWKLIGELEAETDYNFLTKSLDRILLGGDRITFVYNNRVRVHSLQDGRLIYTRQYQGARNGQFPGENVTKKFYINKRKSTSIE